MRLPARLRPCLLPSLVLTGLAVPAQGVQAQTEAAPIEGNVRVEYAEVLRVEPVYSEDAIQCPDLSSSAPTAHRATLAAPGRTNNDTGMMLSLNPGRARPSAPQPAPSAPRIDSDETAQTETGCVPGTDTAGQPALYDVDYILRGIKYRSRLPYDPGNRLQVQLSITPITPPESDPPPES